jgi:Tfp pilus assembly protein PilV
MHLTTCDPQAALGHLRRHPRSGLSLTEVLLAIFIMGIGMLSLLVLFPVGILNMQSAQRNSRMAVAVENGTALAEMPFIHPVTGNPFSIRTDPMNEWALREELPNQTATTPAPASTNPFFNADATPDGQANGAARFDLSGPSPPVFVDPQGTLLWGGGGSSANTAFVGRCLGVMNTPINGPVIVNYVNPNTGTGTIARSYGIRRVAPTFTAGITGTPLASYIRSTFMMLDEVTFSPNGEPTTQGPGSVLIERARRHSWAYMWRRPRASDTKVADLTVVMFSGRQIEGSGFANPPEPYYLGHNPSNAADGRAFQRGSSRAILKVALGTTLPAKRGDIVLDATVIPPNLGNVPPILTHFNGYFYRIESVGEVQPINAAEGYQVLELNRPALADGYVGVMITGVADVIDKNDGRMPPG